MHDVLIMEVRGYVGTMMYVYVQESLQVCLKFMLLIGECQCQVRHDNMMSLTNVWPHAAGVDRCSAVGQLTGKSVVVDCVCFPWPSRRPALHRRRRIEWGGIPVSVGRIFLPYVSHIPENVTGWVWLTRISILPG